MPGSPEEGLRHSGHQLQGLGLLRHRLTLVQCEHGQLVELRLLVSEGLDEFDLGFEFSVFELLGIFTGEHSGSELSSLAT